MLQDLIREPKSGFTIPDPPTERDLLACVHCGLCLNHCPTYRLTGLETESPRGRLFLMRELAEGKQVVNEPFKQHIGLCLNCRNCETVCPSGVRFSVLLEAARGEIVQEGRLSRLEKLVRWVAFKQVFPHPRRLNLIVGLIALYQRLGLQNLARKSGLLAKLGRLGEMEGMLPTRQLRTFKAPDPKPYPRIGFWPKGVRGRVALFTGCIMRAGFGEIHDATVRVLEKNGWRVEVPSGQICCAALHVHAGEREVSRAMARKNIDLFMREGWHAIAVNAAGCGANLKDYPELFRDDPVYHAKAIEFSARVKDVSELLGRHPIAAPTRSIHQRVTYQDACHLAHAQRVRVEPRQILKQIPGVELVEMRASDRCCGSAGIYNIQHPEMADQLVDEKIENISDTRADIVVTANIGCLLQLDYGARRAGWNGRVMHLVELLDEAYR